ncbi:MAG TPA: hypothetical protein DDZ80_10320 [Cyanobacteria bacterium UBA8803]|nr:hypothetical protein [Cyanobacteria bacterium UBA9273]HBL58887.1 hypothetical protein [Cyanobacteria bacterium UBA8803]
MPKTSKEQSVKIAQRFYQEISEIEASNYRGGAISQTHEVDHLVQQGSVAPSQIKVILFQS